MAATPALTAIRYASGPVCSSRSQPGIVRTGTAGSCRVAYTLSTGPCSVASPLTFTPRLPQLGWRYRHPRDRDTFRVLDGRGEHRRARDHPGLARALDAQRV